MNDRLLVLNHVSFLCTLRGDFVFENRGPQAKPINSSIYAGGAALTYSSYGWSITRTPTS